MSWLPVLQPGLDADILLYGEDERKVVEVKGDKDRREMCPVYYDGEGVKGQVGGPLSMLIGTLCSADAASLPRLTPSFPSCP